MLALTGTLGCLFWGHQQLMPSQGAHGCINEEIPAVPSPDAGIFSAILMFDHSLPNGPSLEHYDTRTKSHKTHTPLRFIIRKPVAQVQ